MQPDLIDHHLLKACIEGRREAQKSFYKTFHAYALSICMRYASTREDAVEMMNDGFLKAFKYLKSYDSTLPIKPWLRKLMVNSALDHLKKYEQNLEAKYMEEQIKLLVADEGQHQVSYEDLLDMVRLLPPAYRTVFNLYAIEGYKHDEIAEILGISSGTSKSNYHKAKQKLQQMLAEHFGVNKYE